MNVIGYTNVISQKPVTRTLFLIDKNGFNPYYLKYKEIFFRSEKDITIF